MIILSPSLSDTSEYSTYRELAGAMVKGEEQPALQVIVLGSGGGPLENSITSFLVRSTATGWNKGSILAVDAGVHLAAIVKILEDHPTKTSPPNGDHKAIVTLVDGPFSGLKLRHASAKANAAYITRTLIEACLITHPHLDHISGFVINTAGLPGSRQKRLAGLPSTIEAFKNHIFNNVIWPNLSDENNGAGLVTYMRLVDGGSPAVGDGEGKGYIEICDGLSVKPWSISHGHCIENHTHRGPSAGSDSLPIPTESSPHLSPHTSRSSQPAPHSILSSNPNSLCVYNSTAYFIRDVLTGREILIFGDVEPDSISLSPRNKLVWAEAARKIVAGLLGAIFIECSFDDSQSDDRLYGHMAPRHLIEEMKALAQEVDSERAAKKKEIETKKRKRLSNGSSFGVKNPRRTTRITVNQTSPINPPRGRLQPIGTETPQAQETPSLEELESVEDDGYFPVRDKHEEPLNGLKIVIIHVKDNLTDGPETGEIALKQLEDYETEAQLGCKFVISRTGEAVYL